MKRETLKYSSRTMHGALWKVLCVKVVRWTVKYSETLQKIPPTGM